MRKFDPGQVIGILANLGVILGIALLAIELDQNNELIAAQTRSGRTESRKSEYQYVIENPDVRAAMMQAGSYGSLTEDQVILLNLNALLLINLEYLWQEYTAGLLTLEDLAVEPRRLPYEDPNSIDNITWRFLKDRFNPDFVAWMDLNVVSH